VGKIEDLEAKIHAVADRLLQLRQENARLQAECDSLKGHVALLTGENSKAQRVLAEHEQMRRTREQVIHRVERALTTLNGLRNG